MECTSDEVNQADYSSPKNPTSFKKLVKSLGHIIKGFFMMIVSVKMIINHIVFNLRPTKKPNI